MANMFALPSAVTDENLRLASAVQLKTVLYLFRHSMLGEQVTLQSISDATGYDSEDIKDALIFWQERGLVLRDGQQPPAAQQTVAASPKQETPKAPRAVEKQVEEIPVLKPSLEQVAARCDECESFRFLFAEAQQKLGKTVGYDGQATLIMLHDSYGLPMEVILMLLEYAKTLGKTGYSYIAQIGKTWAEKEIDSLESAESYIKEQTGINALWREFCALTGIKNANPTTKQRQFFSSWASMGFGVDMIYLAYEETVDRTEKFSMAYMNKILISWNNKGVKTPVDAENEKQKFAESKKQGGKKESRSAQSESSYDLDAFTKKSVGLKYKK